MVASNMLYRVFVLQKSGRDVPWFSRGKDARVAISCQATEYIVANVSNVHNVATTW